ncbi:BAG family molecular chaperone regulator 4-like isoform X2 [Cicer arietinum]|uniref:BAG family molecular chaperone regulator 4-like isoform X2 n=1 Tax=Cicer arietinum TaxID=3827 RepID=A0A1S2XMM3_CICAR|nr:BAG family molecular chaperone regulator 4-like isoform X2 [Cicer arietinum]
MIKIKVSHGSYHHEINVPSQSTFDPASKERKIEHTLIATKEVLYVRTEVDKLYQKVIGLERIISGGAKVEDKEFVVLTELLMVQLLKLDSIVAEGEAKMQRGIEVRRVQSYVDIIDNMKARNSAANNAVSLINKWEAFESEHGRLKSPITIQSSTVITQEWEQFE